MPEHKAASAATPLRRKLLLLTVLGLIPLAAFAAISVWFAVDSYRSELQRSTLNLSRAVASAVQAELDASVTVLQALSVSNEVNRNDLEAFHRELVAAVGARPDWVGINLASPDGTLLFRTTRPFGADAGPANERGTLERVIRTREPHVGPLTRGSTGKVAYPVRVPVVRAGELRYVLTAGITPDRMRHLLEKQQVPANWVISVFDTSLKRVARSRDHENTIGGEPAPSLKALLARSELKEGTGLTRAIEGDEIVTGFTRLHPSGWVVAVGAPSGMVQAVVTPTLLWYIAGVGASLAIAVLLALRVARRLNREIGQVVGRAAEVGKGTQAAGPSPSTSELRYLLEKVSEADERVRASEAESREALTEAQRASRAKDEFLAVLSHELRNPLAPIVNVLTLLDLKGGAETAREREILHRQVRHMRRLVDDLLDVSRLVEGKVPLNLRRINLVQVAREAVDSVAGRDGVPSIGFSCSQPEVFVEGDDVRLTQVLANLLANAARHSDGKPIHVEVRADHGTGRVLVRDSGTGMSAATLERAFEPFFQAEPEQGVTGKLGLGLAISKGLVEKHGGSIQASSAGIGKGSEFEIQLPLASTSVEIHALPEEQGAK